VEAFNSSNLDLAIDLLNTMVSLSPDHADAYDYLGQVYFRKEEYQDLVDYTSQRGRTWIQVKESLVVPTSIC